MRRDSIKSVMLIAAVTVTAGCATPAPEGELIADPFESLNRQFHDFNVGVDQVLLRPTAYIYREATPTLFQFLIGNAVDHIRLPITFIHNTLQLDIDGALNTGGRFVVNTLMGAGGLLDPATEIGLPFEQSDGGLTLARYGAEEGPYIVAPFFGPFTGRDFAGRLADFALDPFNFFNIPGGAAVSAARVAVPIVDGRAENFELLDDALYESEDSYTTVRTGYVLSRRRAVAETVGAETESTLPDIYAE